MALSKVDFNSINVTPAASKAIKFNSNNNGLETGDVGGSLVLISEQTASSSSTISFTSGIDSTYNEYVFKIINCHPSASSNFTFQVSIDSGSNYNVAMTTTLFYAYQYENGSSTSLSYNTSVDQAQGTAFQELGKASTDNDSCCSGTLNLFSPSSDTFVKHFIGNVEFVTLDGSNDPYSMNNRSAGYANTTSAVDAVQFKFSSGNIDSGTIKMYGVT